MKTRRPKSPGTDESPERYQIGATDARVVDPVVLLLQKLAAWPETTTAQRRAVEKARQIFDRLPEITETKRLSLELTSPRKWFGDREVFHWWDLQMEDDCIHVSSGGHVYHPESGCETFVSFTWEAIPGVHTEFCDGVASLAHVPDARPFRDEVQRMDLSDPGWRLATFDASVSDPERASNGEAITRPADDSCEFCGRADSRIKHPGPGLKTKD